MIYVAIFAFAVSLGIGFYFGFWWPAIIIGGLIGLVFGGAGLLDLLESRKRRNTMDLDEPGCVIAIIVIVLLILVGAGVTWYFWGIWWPAAVIAGIVFLIVGVLLLALRVDLHKKLGEPKRAFASFLLTKDKLASVTRQLIALASESVAAEKALMIDATKPLLDVVGQLSHLRQAYPQLRTSEHYGTLLAQVRQLADEMHQKAEEYNSAVTRFNEGRAPIVSRLVGVADLYLLTDCSETEIRAVKRMLGM